MRFNTDNNSYDNINPNSEPVGWNIPDETDKTSINSGSVTSVTPTVINEDNTPVFLNSAIGFFFPICYTQINMTKPPKDNDSDDGYKDNPGETTKLDTLVTWQKKVYRNQVILFNIGILITVVTIYILVTHVADFLKRQGVANQKQLWGRGHWSKQAFEAMHYDFLEAWEKEKVNSSHPGYQERLKRVVVKYNSQHI